MSARLPPRRTACDRCRGQKLRCIRDGTNACGRCLRAGAECYTRADAKIGRPVSAIEGRRVQQYARRDVARQSESTERRTTYDRTRTFTPPTTAEERSNSCVNASTDEHGQADVQASSPSISDVLHEAAAEMTQPSSKYQQVFPMPPSLDILDPSTISKLPPPLDVREECERKLAGLHSALVLDLNIIRGSQTADKCTAIINDPEFAQSYNFMIGRMLNNSATFIELLNLFAPQPETEVQRGLVPCSVPTLFSIFTCYVYLIRIYRTIFTCILKSVEEQQKTDSKLPPLFPGLQLGGYSIEDHVDVQVRILVGIAEDMLRKIDKSIGIPGDACDPKTRGLLHNAGISSGLLKAMLELESSEEHDDGILIGDAMHLTNIMKALKSL